MSNLFKYKIALDAELASSENRENEQSSLDTIPYFAFFLVCTVTTVTFSAIVMILNRCFPSSLDGTYLKLFF